MWDKGFIWNPSNCECEYDKSCDIGEYLDYKNCKCSKIIIDKLVEECSENIDGNEMFYNETLDIISSSDNKMVIYFYLFLYLKNRSTNSHHIGCLNINGY